jgi:hypothetical protein
MILKIDQDATKLRALNCISTAHNTLMSDGDRATVQELLASAHDIVDELIALDIAVFANEDTENR